jgi:hypothetical protein
LCGTDKTIITYEAYKLNDENVHEYATQGTALKYVVLETLKGPPGKQRNPRFNSPNFAVGSGIIEDLQLRDIRASRLDAVSLFFSAFKSDLSIAEDGTTVIESVL